MKKPSKPVWSDDEARKLASRISGGHYVPPTRQPNDFTWVYEESPAVKEFFDNIRKTNPIYKEHMLQESKTQEHDGLFYTSDTPTKPGVYRLIIFGHEPTIVELHRDRDNSNVLWYGPDRKTMVRDGDGWWCPLIPRQVMESEITLAYKEGFNDCMKVVTSDWYVAYDQSRSKRVVDEQELADGEPGGAK